MRWWSYLLIGIGGYLVFLIAELPAQHILGWTLGENGKIPFSYATMSGTLRHGKITEVKYQGLPPHKVRWSFAPSGLLLGRISFDLKLRHADHKVVMNAARSFGGTLYLKDIEGQLPASMVVQLAKFNQVSVDGVVELDLDHVVIESDKITSAEGQLQWLNPALLRPFSLKEGNLKADVATDDTGNIKIKINDLGGGTTLDGELSLNSDRSYDLNGQIKPGAKSDPGLSSALKAVAKNQPDGSYRISFSGNL